LSGLCLKGLTIAEVAPEAAAGGPIGKVRDGDAIEIDVAARRMDLLVPTEELARRPGPSNTYAEPAEGWLGLYRANVQSMATGAVLGDVTRQGE
jgi:dihydroxy-acid dehydratase